jgi:glycosyltransferase involved in cell wall biosynthesis
MTQPNAAPAIVYDGLRLFLGACTPSPRGIDRVDIEYARNLLETWPGDVFSLVPSLWGLRLHDRDRSLRGLRYVEEAWRESGDADHDPGLARVMRRFAGVDDGPPGPRRRKFDGLLRAARGELGILRTGPIRGLPAASRTPANALYLNVSQLSYGLPFITRWLRRRPDVRAIYLMHDVIPIEYPDLVAPVGTRMAHSLLASVRRHAAGLIFTTEAARVSVLRELDPTHLPAMLTLPLPIAQAFLEPEPEDAALRAQNYFIVCSAIDPRKNHLMLLRIWADLVRRHGPRAPRLAVIGSPAWAGNGILQTLEQCGALRQHVIVASGLSSPALRRLMAHARALLLPSRAEGFGLPAIEALTLGTPAVLSDIPALREVAGNHAIFLPADDQDAWLTTIESLSLDGARLDGLRRQIDGFTAMRAADYFDGVHRFLHQFAGENDRAEALGTR